MFTLALYLVWIVFPSKSLLPFIIRYGVAWCETQHYLRKPLHHCCWRNLPEQLLILLNSGFPVNSIDAYSRTPLYVSANLSNKALVGLLLEFRADPNIGRLPSDEVPLLAACVKGDLEIATLLIEGGADVNYPSREGFTPLMGAVVSGDLELVMYLVKRGSELSAIDGLGTSVLEFAIEAKSRDIEVYLRNVLSN